ncbi:MAG: hypothetical protein NT150_06295 [Bacteroidetes bacterium]|nr:hypothetical protein [Bacteroidota bacterium]
MWREYKKIYLLAAILFLIAAYFSAGFYQFDEHTQVMEFAGWKLGLTEKENLSWEFAAQMRAGIQPLMVYVAHKIFAFLSIDSPFTIAFILRLFSAALSFLSIHLLIRAFIDKINGDKLKQTYVLLSFFLWFLVFNAVRFSSENIAGRLFVIAFALFISWKDQNKKKYFLLGLILGLSFLFRYQNAFLIVGFVAWLFFINKSKIGDLLLLSAGIILLFGIGILIDRWFYDEWVLSTWSYFDENMLQHKMEGFGLSPWYYYFVQIFNVGIPPFSLLYIVPFILLLINRWKNPLVWIILPFLIIHIYIGHKELRFLFPALGFIPLLAVQAGEVINEKWQRFLPSKLFKVFVVLFVIQNGLFLLLVSFKAADSQVNLYETVYNNYNKPTVVFYIKDNPYSRAMEVYYYKRKNLKVEEIHSLNEIRLPKDSVVLFSTINNDEAKVMEDAYQKVVYTSLPEWVKMFNVFHWVDRTRFWRVYEVKNIPAVVIMNKMKDQNSLHEQ